MEKTSERDVHINKVDGLSIPNDRLADVLPQHRKAWYLTPHLLKLNLCIGVVLLSATTMGFDGSMMNGLQGLDTWLGYFGNPNGVLLGVMNAVMFLGGVSGLRSLPTALINLLTVTQYSGCPRLASCLVVRHHRPSLHHHGRDSPPDTGSRTSSLSKKHDDFHRISNHSRLWG